uniref:von Hippel-Lindau disease tumour suppressor beta domain-containing protein n=1 Tax=Coccolithus braarudii TaxID=221442 RepID=A0A7S0L9X3_9EUKA
MQNPVAVTVSFRSEASEAVMLLWVDDDGHEQPFGVLAPTARLDQGTYAGARWRLRAAGNGHPQRKGALVLEIFAGIIEVGNCACEGHAATLSPYVPVAEVSVNRSTLVVISALSVTARVLKWDGLREVAVGALSPTSHIVLTGMLDGDVVVARRSHDNALVMQHTVGDYVVTDCSGGAPIARGADDASKRRKLQRTRSQLERDNNALRAQLGQLREVDLSAIDALPADVLIEYAAQAHQMLTQLDAGDAGPSVGADDGKDLSGHERRPRGRVAGRLTAPKEEL